MGLSNLHDIPAFIAKNGSEIHELLAQPDSAIRNRSSEEARLQAGGSTQEHFHFHMEDLYSTTHGLGGCRLRAKWKTHAPSMVSPLRRG